MKIALISNLYGRYKRGGAEEVVEMVAEGLRANGDDVFVISARPYEGLQSLNPSMEVENGIRVHRFYPLNIFFYSNARAHGIITRLIWTFLDIFNFSAGHKIKKIIEAEKPDLILVHNVKGIGYWTIRSLKKWSNKLVLTLHDVQYSNPSGLLLVGKENDWLNKSITARIYQKICRWILKPVRNVVSPSQFLADFYSERFFFKSAMIKVLPNPVLKEIQPSNLPGSDLRLLFVGQIEKHKGINWLIEVLKKINFQVAGRPITLTVAGDGGEREVLQSKTSQIMWLGRVPRTQVSALLSQTDYLIFPSLCYENCPTVIGQSFGLGVPVIAANIGGVSELVFHQQNGFLFQPLNQESLIKTLESAARLEMPEYEKMRRASYSAAQRFSFENYLAQLKTCI